MLREFMTGSLIYLNGHGGCHPGALPGRVAWLGQHRVHQRGVDPQQREFSPGSVLSFINTQNAWSEARSLGKPLRYSFGRADREYKTAGATGCRRSRCEAMSARKQQLLKRPPAQQALGAAGRPGAAGAGRCPAGPWWLPPLPPVAGLDRPRGLVRRHTCSTRRVMTTATTFLRARIACRCALMAGGLRVEGEPGDAETLILEWRLSAGWFGRFLDPQVWIGEDRQDFERGLDGLRYLNLSGAGRGTGARRPKPARALLPTGR